MGAGSQRIVIGDSDRTVSETLQIRLEVAGYQAFVARTGAAALDLALKQRAAAMIIDAKLADTDGSPLLNALIRDNARFPCPTLVVGRNLSPSDIDLAVRLGANDGLVKPFSGAEALERIGRILRNPGEPVPPHVVESQCLDLKDLNAKYAHEAAEHRRILFSRGSGMCPTWRNFRQFLADMGPAPSTDHVATRLVAGDLTYVAGKVAWIHKDRQPSLVDRWSMIESRTTAGEGRTVTVGGRPVDYATLATYLEVPEDSMTVALRDKPCADDLVRQASIADALSQEDCAWLTPDRRDAFMMAYRMWHMQVQPRFAAAATPAFLYLFSALPALLKLRDSLAELGLWDPPTEQGKSDRDQHPLWRRYGENANRLEAARQEFTIYKRYSLSTELDEFWERVKLAEERFRRRIAAPAKAA